MESVFRARELLIDLRNWMLVLAPIAGALALAYHLTMRHLSTDETQAAGHTRSARSAIIGTMVALGAAGIISYLAGYVVTATP